MFSLKKKDKFRIFFCIIASVFFLGSAWSSDQAQTLMDLSGRWESSIGSDFIIDQINNRVEWFLPADGQKVIGEISGNLLNADWDNVKISGRIFTDNTGLSTIIEWQNDVVFKRIFENTLHSGIEDLAEGEIISQDGGQGSNWQLLVQGVEEVYASGKHLYITTKGSGDIYKRGAALNWIRIGGPGYMFAGNHRGDVYGISNVDLSVWWYSGTPNKWNKIKSSPVDSIFAGGNMRQVGAIDSYSKDVYLYYLKGCYPNCMWEWTRIGGPGVQFIQGFWSIFALGVGKGSVWKWSGNQNWKQLGGPAYMIAVDGTAAEVLYALSPNRKRVMRYFPGIGQWEDYTFNLPDTPKTIDAGWNVIVAHFGEEAWMMQNNLKQWIKISGAWRVKRVIAAGENKPAIYCLFNDDSLWRYTAFD